MALELLSKDSVSTSGLRHRIGLLCEQAGHYLFVYLHHFLQILHFLAKFFVLFAHELQLEVLVQQDVALFGRYVCRLGRQQLVVIKIRPCRATLKVIEIDPLKFVNRERRNRKGLFVVLLRVVCCGLTRRRFDGVILL